MIIFKPYTNVKDFLQRFTILKIGKLHIRLHKIVDEDQTTLYHNHPFHYISIILKGGYVEKILLKNKKVLTKSHNFLSIIFRKNTTYHRIEKLKKETITLFIAYGNYKWQAMNTENNTANDGIFERIVNNKIVWSKKENGIWFIGHLDKEKAIQETRHSIHQI